MGELLAGYRRKSFTVYEVLEEVRRRIERASDRHIWISLISEERLRAYVRALAEKSPDDSSLFGIPFAIKDNIDLEGVATTAGCPGFSYTPSRSAAVVQRLIDAGAIPIGKTNLDQFATGLSGTRSPYGACLNSVDPAFISGGSSSGSAVSVATGVVSFALGTDTAGSGRVPAAFNGIVGLKPTRGRISTRGVVPACRSIDCVSIFATSAEDAAAVEKVAESFEPEEGFSRQHGVATATLGKEFRFGIPRRDQLQFFGDLEYARLFDAAIERLEGMGGRRVDVDCSALLEAGRLLYEGAWVAERFAAVGDFIERQPDAVHPVTRKIIASGRAVSAVDAYRDQYHLAELVAKARTTWNDMDVLVTPTTGTIYRIHEMELDPVRLNANLGYYTSFMNLMDLAGVAVPAGTRRDGLPFGITLVGPAWSDSELLDLAGRFSLAEPISIAVCGAHMEGLPLNHELTNRGGRFVSRTRTSAAYRLFALPGEAPYRPGMIRASDLGSAIEVEVWTMDAARFADFVAGIPAPLSIGKVELENGERVCGFLCEPFAIENAMDITALGGWRAHLAGRG